MSRASQALNARCRVSRIFCMRSHDRIDVCSLRSSNLNIGPRSCLRRGLAIFRSPISCWPGATQEQQNARHTRRAHSRTLKMRNYGADRVTVDLSCMGNLITPSRSSRETAPTQIQDIRHCDAWLATTVLPLHFQNEIAISAQALLRVGIHGRPPGFTFVGAQQETQLPRRFGRNALGISR